MTSQQPPYRPQNVRFFDQLSLAAVQSAVSVSRHFLRLTLSKWQAAFIEDDALLIASELVTNAITATGILTENPTWGELEKLNLVQVRLVGLQDSVVIEVWDVSDEAPSLRHVEDDAEGGRGLLLVQQLAKRWGSYRTAGGKVVWAELAVRPPKPTPLPQREKSARPTIKTSVLPDVGFLRRVLVGLELAL
ncbi:ATP-binding protein [Streptomyces globisporus]|uniref:ATP-binding protein n=1 Tax=Streptomyces globisporus TaxID=1908 RepID=A0A927GMQ5_STRGL|nr:ATP-binding protein [Streptomyces globisporus]